MSFRTLARDFMRSPRYRGLKPATKIIYERAFENMREMHELSGMSMSDVRIKLQHLEDRPGIYNQARSFGSAVMEWNGAENPFRKLDKMKLGRHRAWTDREVMAFRNQSFWTHPTMATEATILFELALCTGQRFGDLVSLTRDNFSDDLRWLELSQEKTGESVRIPIPERVGSLMGEWTRFRSRPAYIRNVFRGCAQDAGIKGKTFHGLRMTAVRRMAEAGCTEREIMAYTGHKTSTMVGHYVSDASRARMALNAMKKMEGVTWL